MLYKKMNKSSGAICGGIIKESEWNKAIKENKLNELMMCFVMPDDKYDLYWKLKQEGKNKEATKVFREHAWSVI